jgi:hypothetical protein
MNETANPAAAHGMAAALVIRVWRDSPDSPDWRARITIRADLENDQETTVMAATPEEVYGEVRAWLEGFLARSGRSGR